ncbi:MAG: hypothetical protein ABSG95_15175 [Solirubrobacteraceae bacterium]
MALDGLVKALLNVRRDGIRLLVWQQAQSPVRGCACGQSDGLQQDVEGIVGNFGAESADGEGECLDAAGVLVVVWDVAKLTTTSACPHVATSRELRVDDTGRPSASWPAAIRHGLNRAHGFEA